MNHTKEEVTGRRAKKRVKTEGGEVVEIIEIFRISEDIADSYNLVIAKFHPSLWTCLC